MWLRGLEKDIGNFRNCGRKAVLRRPETCPARLWGLTCDICRVYSVTDVTYKQAQNDRRTTYTPGTGNHECRFRAGQPRFGGGDPFATNQPARRFGGARHAGEARKEGLPETPAGRP